jgi:hypothetical protein
LAVGDYPKELFPSLRIAHDDVDICCPLFCKVVDREFGQNCLVPDDGKWESA